MGWLIIALVINDLIVQASHAELTWLNDREDKETGRDWADKNLKLGEVEQYYEVSLNSQHPNTISDPTHWTLYKDSGRHVTASLITYPNE